MDYDKAKAIKEKTVTILNLLTDMHGLADSDKEVQTIINQMFPLLVNNLLEEHIFNQYSELDDLDVLTEEQIEQLHLTPEDVDKIAEQVYAKTSTQRKKSCPHYW